jgi:hypothetical protein
LEPSALKIPTSQPSASAQLLLVLISQLLVLPDMEAGEARDDLVVGVVLSITGTGACLECKHEREMDRCDFQGPPESDFTLKNLVLQSYSFATLSFPAVSKVVSCFP